MAQPAVSWYNRNNDLQVTNWAIGIVDAGSTSTDFGVLIWNNRSQQTAVSDMTNCTISTKDSAGGNTGDLVVGTWINVIVDSMGETTPTPIGGTATKAIRATGQTAGSVAAGVIKGSVNDGTKTNAKDNFCELTLRAVVPANATAGTFNFLTRVSYNFT